MRLYMERIKYVAIKFILKGKEIIYTSKQGHVQCIEKAYKNKVKHIDSGIKGFVTNFGRFVSRQEAGEIAFRAGQTKWQEPQLFSYHISLRK